MILAIANLLYFVASIPLPNPKTMQIPKFYYPKITAKSFPIAQSLSGKSQDENQVIKNGVAQLISFLGVGADDLRVSQSHRDRFGITHIYCLHLLNNVTIDNQSASIHIKNGQTISYSASFDSDSVGGVDKRDTNTSPSVTLDEAVNIAVEAFKAPRDDVPAKKVYLELEGGKLVLAHQFQIRDDSQSKWLQVSVDAKSGSIVQVVNYVKKSRYTALKFPKNTPDDNFDRIRNPADDVASPVGWNNDGAESFLDTQGNNVDSNVAGYRVEGGEDTSFDTKWDARQEPGSQANKDTAIVNNFYVTNMMHDIFYQYGFDEVSGNFQTNNFGRGGLGNDRVIVNNQAIGNDNANFATPPDGQQPTMNMYIWDLSTPHRDGSLENDIPIHEYGHGISTRLTGGSAQGNCLETIEAGGLGEGWSDAFALFILRNESDSREKNVIVGQYVYNDPNGIRSKPYSTDMKVNPYTLSYAATQNEVHSIGELWANTLYELYWNFVDAHGFAPNYLDATQLMGNIMVMHVVVGGLKLQPCSPTFLTARDAILAADQSYYNGRNQCLIWKAFAKRGMGIDAVNDGYIDGFGLPPSCGAVSNKIVKESLNTASKFTALVPNRNDFHTSVITLNVSRAAVSLGHFKN